MASHSDGPTPDFRRLFESVPGLYLVLLPGLKIVAASDAHLQATMTTREQNLRSSLRRVLHDRVTDAMPLHKYDTRRPVNSLVFNDASEISYIIHRVEDVTDFVRLKQHGSQQVARTVEMQAELSGGDVLLHDPTHEGNLQAAA